MSFSKLIVLVVSVFVGLSLVFGKNAVDKAIESAGAAVITKATGVDLPTALSLLKTERTETLLHSENGKGKYNLVASKGFETRVLVKEELLEKKLKQLFDKMNLPKKDQDLLLDTLAASHADHDFLIGSTTEGRFEFYYINFYPRGTHKGFDTYVIEALKTSGSIGLFPHTDFVQVTKSNIISTKSRVDVRYRPAEVTAGDIAFMWNLMTKSLISAMKEVSASVDASGDVMSLFHN
eukprot:gene7971-9505_t